MLVVMHFILMGLMMAMMIIIITVNSKWSSSIITHISYKQHQSLTSASIIIIFLVSSSSSFFFFFLLLSLPDNISVSSFLYLSSTETIIAFTHPAYNHIITTIMSEEHTTITNRMGERG